MAIELPKGSVDEISEKDKAKLLERYEQSGERVRSVHRGPGCEGIPSGRELRVECQTPSCSPISGPG